MWLSQRRQTELEETTAELGQVTVPGAPAGVGSRRPGFLCVCFGLSPRGFGGCRPWLLPRLRRSQLLLRLPMRSFLRSRSVGLFRTRANNGGIRRFDEDSR